MVIYKEWVQGWVPKSVFSLGNGVSSVEAWFSTVLAQIGGDQLHVMVADVIKSFDTLSILDCALGRLGLPAWFRKVYFACHSQVRLRFKLASGLEEPWCRDGGIPQGCPLSMVLHCCLVCLLVQAAESHACCEAQLHADNLCPNALFGAARFSLLSMSGRLGRMCLLVSVFSSALPRRLGGL